MAQTVFVEGKGKVSLADKDYLAAGGQATVYAKSGVAYKIYHVRKSMIPVAKIQELQGIKITNVLSPQHILRDKNDKPIGYTMPFKKNTEAICRLYTQTFKNNNNITKEMLLELVDKIQRVVDAIHGFRCLIVDLNEMNVLVATDFVTPYFIDVDSYQTPSFKATAIMETVRDPLVQNNQFTKESDWFAFAIMAFQVYVGIHPYKGRHPKYKPNDWKSRMQDGVSVFDPDVKIPRACADFSIIPPNQLEWFKYIFVKNQRGVPPLPSYKTVGIPHVPVVFDTITSTSDFDISLVHDYGEDIVSVFDVMGINYVVTNKNVYRDRNLEVKNVDKIGRVAMTRAGDMTPIMVNLQDGMLTFRDLKGTIVGKINANHMMVRNSAVYSSYEGRFMENSFEKLGSKIIHQTRVAGNVVDQTTSFYDGVVFQNLLGRWFVTLPFERGKCLQKMIPELDGYRIAEAKSEENVCVVLAEKNNQFDKFIFEFNTTFTDYLTRKLENIGYSAINFTVLPNGVCVLITDSEMEVFKDKKVKVVQNPPLDSGTRIFNVTGKVYFIDKGKLCSVHMKK